MTKMIEDYPGQAYFWEHNPRIRRAEIAWRNRNAVAKNFKFHNITVDCSAWHLHVRFVRFFKIFGWEFGMARLLKKAPPRPDYLAKKVK